MRVCIESNRFDLNRGQSVGLHDGKGARVRVLSGKLWVTHEGDARDLFFGDCERFEVERNGVTVLHALKSTQLQVEETRPAASKTMAWLRAAGKVAWNAFVESQKRRAEERLKKSRYYRI